MIFDLVRSTGEWQRKLPLAKELWVTRGMAEFLDGLWPEPWLPVRFEKPQFLDGEEVVCYWHPARSRIVTKAMNREPLLLGEQAYVVAMYGPDWREELWGPV